MQEQEPTPKKKHKRKAPTKKVKEDAAVLELALVSKGRSAPLKSTPEPSISNESLGLALQGAVAEKQHARRQDAG